MVGKIGIILSLLVWATPVYAQSATDWPMTAANPSRTSHNAVEVPGALKTAWYRVIQPYIDPKVQLIAADNKIFVSTSKGLYAFDATSGNQLWVYGTELPLGNSPTYYNGTVYVGGYDHKIHAINASNGTLKTGWTFINADAGFDTNPLVINDSYTGNQPVIYAGNRDGYFYALDGNTGALKWKFQTGGPIHFSAAYKNGTLYFASDDAYAYALNASNGSVVWKSEKFSGTGFDSYWPVIWTDTYPSSPTYNRDFVILAGSLKAGRWMCDLGAALYGCQIHSPNFEMFANKPGCSAVGSQPYLWNSAVQTLSCDSIYDYYNNNPKWNGQRPWWRITFILDRATGAEQTPYAPFNPSGYDGDNQGFHQPPVVGADGVLYQRVGTEAGGNGGCSGWIVGWKFGTKYVGKIASEWAACDEPSAFTSGGKYIYYGEGSFNHEGFGTINTTTTPNDTKWTSQVMRTSGRYNNLTLTDGKFGGTSGAYAYMDGFNNYSPIPYTGKLFIINGNTLYALSATGTATTPLSEVQPPASAQTSQIQTSRAQLDQKLNLEIQKMLSAGHLRPGVHSSGLTSQTMDGAYSGPIPGDNLAQYFKNPSETVTTLIRVLEYINSNPSSQVAPLANQIRNYIQSNYGPGAPYAFTNFAHIGWKNGAKREYTDDLPEFSAQTQSAYDPNSAIAVNPRTCISAGNNLKIASPNTAVCFLNEQSKSGFPPESLYAGWKYAQTFPGTAATIFNAMKDKLSWPGNGNDMTDANLAKYPYLLNQYISGYQGYIELDRMANNLSSISQSSRYSEYTRLQALRWNTYSKDPSYSSEEYSFNSTLNAARNFMYLTPELGDMMRANVLTKVQGTVDQYTVLTPHWFVAKHSHSGPESYGQPLYDYQALFQARAYILKQPFSELVKYLDIPAFARGDLFYIQNLTALLQSSGTGGPTPTASASPPAGTKPGDANGDNRVDGLDYIIWLTHYGQTVSGASNGNFNGDTKVDGLDYVVWLINYGR